MIISDVKNNSLKLGSLNLKAHFERGTQFVPKWSELVKAVN